MIKLKEISKKLNFLKTIASVITSDGYPIRIYVLVMSFQNVAICGATVHLHL